MFKTILFFCFTIIFSVGACNISYALQIPKPSPKDKRVRYVPYDGGDVVKIVGYFGLQTFILFSNSETITDLGSGDTDAWAIGVIQAKNGFFIKPKDEKASTNLTVITSKRHYNFDLIQDPSEDKSPYYMVQFTYPQDEAEAKAEKERQTQIDSLLAYQGIEGPANSSDRLNKSYLWDGSISLRPIEAWDNGTFTFLRFSPGRDFPAIFTVNPENENIEATVNTHVEGDIIVIHKVAQRFNLRLGNQVTGILNTSYNPVGVSRTSKTMSPYVHRVVVGGK